MRLPAFGIEVQGMSRRAAFRLCKTHYPWYSLKRRLALGWNLVAIALAREVYDPWMTANAMMEIRCLLDGQPGRSGHFMLTHKMREKKRAYAFIVDSAGSPVAFAKLSVHERDHERLRREIRGIERAVRQSAPYQVPVVTSVRAAAGVMGMFTAASPGPARVIDKKRFEEPIGVISAIKGNSARSYSADEIVSTSWWADFAVHAPLAFHDQVLEMVQASPDWQVAFAHGDFGSENLLAMPNNSKLLVIDWESWASDAPTESDRLAYWLGYHEKSIKRTTSNKGLVQLLYGDFIGRKAIGEDDTLLALAFLVARNFRPAVRLADAVATEMS